MKILKKFKALAIVSAIFLSQLSFAENLSRLKYFTEEYPPFNYTDSGILKGIAVEILEKSVAAAGEALPTDNVKVLPWSRAYRQTQKGPMLVLFSTTRTEQREPLFKWAGPIIDTKVVLASRKDKNIVINSKDDLKAYSIAAVRDDIGEQLVKDLGVIPENKIQLSVNAESIIKKLDAGRVDLLAYEVNSMRYQIKNMGLNNEDFVAAFTLKEGQLFYAFSKDVDDQLVEKLQGGIDAIKNDGTYESILKKYQ